MAIPPHPLPPMADPMPGWRAADAGAQRQAWLLFWFYLGVPLLLGFLLGWLRVGRAVDWPLAASLLYWILTSLLSTALLGAATAAIAPLLRRLRCPLWLTLLAGQLIGGLVLVTPALEALRAVIRATLHPSMVMSAPPTMDAFLQRLPSNAVLWIGLNLLFFHGLRLARFGYVPRAARVPGEARHTSEALAPDGAAGAADSGGLHVAGADAVPPFMARVRPERRGAVLALEADGHYLRVHTESGTDLILYRLSDAMQELQPGDGARVHRSWWVAARALAPGRHRDVLQLTNGIEVPVSRSYRLAARERGWLAGADPGGG